jgi:peptidoglycan/xylan/chitin deacetylase (PgdA/CDA1 family)
MKVTHFLSKSRGTVNLLLRIGSIMGRFGLTPKKFEKMLKRYSAVTRDLGCVPTFPVTAVILKRHPKVIRELVKQGIEFAVHGYVHTDYSVIPLSEQTAHFKKAIDIFRICQVPFAGFRAPFLRISSETPKALGQFEFTYDSSYAVHWNVVDKTYPKQSWRAYLRVLDFYQSRKAEDYLALPRFVNGIVEIPVSIPDDEAMVDRLGITDAREISKIWRVILQRTYDRGELFTLSLHPERISLCEAALVEVIREARELDPPVWVTTLSKITEWWNERAKFSLKINSQGNGRYGVQAECSEKATLLLRNCKVNAPVSRWSNGYQSVSIRDFVLESPKRPVIGVSPNCSLGAVSFLNREGFVVEQSDQRDNYGVYFNNLAHFKETDEKWLTEELQQSNTPLIRYGRWPNRAKSALSITGDIDSMTLGDFALRILENWQHNGKQRSISA